MAAEAHTIFGGISDVSVPTQSFDFGYGVILSPAEGHLMRPMLMTFRRPDSSYPAWQSATGSFGFDIVGEIKVPAAFNLPQWFDHANTIWWLAALLRLRATSKLRVPVLSNKSFCELATGASFWPVEGESERTRLHLEPTAGDLVSVENLEWIREHWVKGGRLMRSSNELNLAFQAFDQSSFNPDPTLALLLLWGALETLFSPGRSELRFRISSNIATFLEPPGQNRAVLQREIAKLYDARSAAAHGRPEQALEPLVESYSILKRVLLRIIEQNHVASVAEIEALLFEGK